MELSELMQDYTQERKVGAQTAPSNNGADAQPGDAAPAPASATSTDDEPAQNADTNANEGTPAQTAQPGDTTQTQSQNPNPEQSANPDASAVSSATELTDEQVLKYLKEKKGLGVESLDDINTTKPLTAEEEQHQAKVKRDKAITFALNEGLFDSETLQQYSVDNARTPEEIVYDHFASAQRQEDADISDEDIRERFEEEYGLNHEEGSWRRKNGQQRMESFKQQYLNHQYGDVINAEQHYDSFKEQETNMRNYAKSVDDIFAGFDKEYTFQLTDKGNEGQTPKSYDYKFPYIEEEMQALKKEFLTEDVLKKAAKGELDVKALQQSVQVAVYTRFMPKIIKEVAYAYASDKLLETQMERQGVKPVNEAVSSQNPGVNQSKNLQMAADFIKKTIGKTVSVN